jgi:hypothetical protein
MPKGTKVHRLKEKLMRKGKSKSSAIAIAQSVTKQSYKTGKSLKKGKRK